MDKKSRQILAYMRDTNSIGRAELLRHFDLSYTASFEYLLAEKFIAQALNPTSSPRIVNGRTVYDQVLNPTDSYHITGLGLDFLEHYTQNQLLRWLPLILSIYAAFLSTMTSIFMPLLRHFFPHIFP